MMFVVMMTPYLLRGPMLVTHLVSPVQLVGAGGTKMNDYGQHPRQVGEELGTECRDHLSDHVQKPLLLLERDHMTEVIGQMFTC